MEISGAPAIPGYLGREVITADVVSFANKACKHCKGGGYIVTTSGTERIPKPCRALHCALHNFQLENSGKIVICEGKVRWKVDP